VIFLAGITLIRPIDAANWGEPEADGTCGARLEHTRDLVANGIDKAGAHCRQYAASALPLAFVAVRKPVENIAVLWIEKDQYRGAVRQRPQ